MTAVRITVGHLYPDLMSTYGDRGNVETILRRCGWRGIATGEKGSSCATRSAPTCAARACRKTRCWRTS